MSNTAVGTLYKRIIDQVVEASKSDFEENGVNNRMVQTFQETWQEHLSKRRTAHFPWEPTPVSEPSEPGPSGRTAPAGGRNNNAASSPAQTNAGPNGVHIKQEPGQGNEAPTMSMAPATGFISARDRAAHLSQEYQQTRMSNAAPSNPAFNSSPINLPGQQGPSGYSASPYGNQQMHPQQQQRAAQQQWAGQQPPHDLKQYPQGQQYADVKQAPPHIKQEPRPDSFGLSQTDGAGDEKGEDEDPNDRWCTIMARNRAVKADGEKMRQADGMLKHHVAEQMRRMEGGGLLVPLDERYSSKQRQKGARRISATAAKSQGLNQGASGEGPVPAPPARFDGGDEDDEDDKDAINSDLDDPEDEVDDGNVGEEYEGDTIICLYDKVQRVKNKWKCTLKDGVVNVDGKDYVFHKANGEFEW